MKPGVPEPAVTPKSGGTRTVLISKWGGAQIFDHVRYSQLVKVADARKVTKKTYNNVVSPLRCVFEYGYRDHPEKHTPAIGLKGFRITKKDRPVVDPFPIHEAEVLTAQIHRDWGEAQGNYDEFRFFTGLRPSEQIALLVSDCDVSRGKVNITKACVLSRDKDRTKTSTDRIVDLCPRALLVQAPARISGELTTREQNPSRSRVLYGKREADPKLKLSVGTLAHPCK